MTEDKVLPLARPPVRQSTVVRATQAHTFRVFIEKLADWWPLDPFSYGGSTRIETVSVDGRTGGEVWERWHDGSVHPWGTILEWNPPGTVTLSWNVTGEPTEVELRFVPLDNSTTRVELEHRGWDRLSPAELEAACALPGGYAGGAFNQGWATILDSLRSYLE